MTEHEFHEFDEELLAEQKYLQAAVESENQMKIITTNGYQMCGRIEDWDAEAVLVACGDGTKKLVYKHAISTVAPVEWRDME